MADSKITALASIGTGTDPANDQLVIVDVSDVLPTGMATTGTTKRVGLNQLLSSSPTATGAFSVTGLVTAGSASITGATTVGTTLGVTGVSTFAAGTALLPALTTTGDTNTGIFYPAADTFAVTTGGTERYRVDSSGNVGIGVTPLYKFHAAVTSGAVGAFRATTAAIARLIVGNTVEDVELKVNANGDGQLTANASKYLGLGSGGINDRVILDASGNLGIGVTPDFKFVVNGTQAVPATSGSATDNGSLRIGAPGTGLCIDSGVTAATDVYAWFQARSRSNYATNFNLVFNPNGGNVGIGYIPTAGSLSKVLFIGTGTEPTAGATGAVQYFTSTRSASNTIPAILCEGSGVTNAGITSTTVTNKIAIKVNGTIYYLLATTSAA